LKYSALMTVLFLAQSAVGQEVVASESDGYSIKLIVLGTLFLIEVIVLIMLSNLFKALTAKSGVWKKALNKKTASVIILGFLFLQSQDLLAQSDGVFSFGGSWDSLLLFLNGFLLLVIILLLYNVQSLIGMLRSDDDKEAVPSGIIHSLTDAVPVEREHEVMTDHEYDGIHELDNNLPPWWVLGFYITIGFAFIYIIYYHFYEDGKVMENEFTAEMTKADAEAEARMASGDVIDENNVVFLADQAALDAGKEIFNQPGKCATCHGANGEGNQIGPNLADKYWIHGGGIQNVFKTIKYGVTEKGMIAWETQLTPDQMQQVASYVISLQGTNPPNAKEPQGELWEDESTPEGEEEVSDTTSAEMAMIEQ
jgi:cytochrome c oxidase cbb3-type subunit 3